MLTLTLGFTEWADPASAQQRLDLPRYSLDVPTGWSSQVENGRWTLYPTGVANELGLGVGRKWLGHRSDAHARQAHRQLWATAQ
jgi:hypothetical protein